MTTAASCPPIPTLEQLNTTQYQRVNVNNLEPGETVVLSIGVGYMTVNRCMDIVAVNDPQGMIRYRINGENNVWEQDISDFNNARFYRRRPPQSAGKLHRRIKHGKTKRTPKNKRKTRKHRKSQRL